jgi:hypothetical protein
MRWARARPDRPDGGWPRASWARPEAIAPVFCNPAHLASVGGLQCMARGVRLPKRGPNRRWFEPSWYLPEMPRENPYHLVRSSVVCHRADC